MTPEKKAIISYNEHKRKMCFLNCWFNDRQMLQSYNTHGCLAGDDSFS